MVAGTKGTGNGPDRLGRSGAVDQPAQEGLGGPGPTGAAQEALVFTHVVDSGAEPTPEQLAAIVGQAILPAVGMHRPR